MRLEGKVALVTGAAYGIGAATAEALAAAGSDVVVCGRTAASVEETGARVRALGRRVLCLPLDLRDDASLQAALDAVWDEFGGCDILVNNAGASMVRPALEVTREDFAALLEVNLTGTFCLSRAVAARWIEEARPGVIISVGSVLGIVGAANSAAYGISKAGVAQMTRALAIEWAPHGIRVNAIAPGSTETPSRKALQDPAKRPGLLAKFPLHRFGQPSDMAEAITYLAGAGFVTGHVLVLDGGLSVK